MNCYQIKGMWQRIWFETLLLWSCLFHKQSKPFFLFVFVFPLFECVWCCVYLYACEIILSCASLMTKTTLNLLTPITQKNEEEAHCALCMIPHAFLFFYFTCQVLYFPYLSLLFFEYSEELHSIFEQEWVTTKKCSAIRNCEFFLNKTVFFCCLSLCLWILLLRNIHFVF